MIFKMKLLLYKIDSCESNRVNKTEHLHLIEEMKGTLKSATSVLNPTFLLDFRDENLIIDDDCDFVVDENNKLVIGGDLISLFDVNYIYCPEFNRYYFVTDIQVVNNSLAYVSCRIDVLMSYKDQIYDESAYIARNESEYNTMLTDNSEQISDDYEVTKITDIYSPNRNIIFTSNPENNCIFNSIVEWKDSDDVDFTPKSIIDKNYNLPSVYFNKMSAKGANRPVMISRDAVANILWLCTTSDNSETYKSMIKNITMYPFTITSMANEDQSYIRIGDVNFKQYANLPFELDDYIKCNVMNSMSSPYLYLADIDFSKYEFDWCSLQNDTWDLYVPFYGFVNLDLNKLVPSESYLVLYYVVDWTTGDATAFLWDYKLRTHYWSSPVNIGIKLAIDNTNMQSNENSMQTATTQMVLGNIASAVSTIGSIVAIASGVGAGIGAMGLVGSATGFVKTNANYANNLNKIVSKGNTEVSSSSMSLFTRYEPYIRKIHRKKIIDSNDPIYLRTYGKPLFKTYKLENLRDSGYTVTSNIQLQGDYGTKTERDEVKSLLDSGIYL